MKRFTDILILTSLVVFLTNLPLSTFANPKLRPQIRLIVTELQKDEYVHFGYPVGIDGEPETDNKYYKLFMVLSKIATNEELVELTNSSSKNIVVYSFAILYSRGYEHLKAIFTEHISDKAYVRIKAGCVGIRQTVKQFMLLQLRPSELAPKQYLTIEEFKYYCNQFKQEDKLFQWE